MEPTELTLMMEPPPASTMRGPTRAMRRKTPFMLRPTTLSHMASVTAVGFSVEQ